MNVRTILAGAAVATMLVVRTPAYAGSTPEQVADALQQAVKSGDGAAVKTLLLPDALVFESGGAEASVAEYAAHHLPADMAFLADIAVSVVARRSGGDEDSAWVATRTRMQGSYKGKAIDLDSTETLVLARRDGEWRIAHVHWSSAPHREAGH